jgi:23S rRNA (guanine745-N1)-methyltransferase
MTLHPNSTLICPLDGHPLERYGHQLTCQNGHSFDAAKRGYFHLLPAQFKNSKDPGDSKQMIEARHRFLSNGFYQELANNMASFSAIKSAVSILDAGCGEGYYLRQLETYAPHIQWIATGLDISKPAIANAAKLNKACCWMVASNANIPLPDNSIDVLWCVFGFPHEDEFMRVLKPGGRLIQVDAGSNHLLDLRKIIYPEVKIKQPPALFNNPMLSDGRSESLEFSMTLDTQNIADLMLMTPHLFKASKAGIERAMNLKELDCRAHITLRERIKSDHKSYQ